MHRRAFLQILVGVVAAPVTSSAQQPAPPLPGTPAPPGVVSELQQALADAIARLHAMDEAGVLRHVSDRYRADFLTKPALRQQLRALLTVYDALRANVRIDVVRMLGADAWVYSTGEVSGRARGLGAWMSILSWDHEPQLARREQGVWRLYGDAP